MSDPVPNAEIEDVLSSIRRLVSGDVDAKNGIDNRSEKRTEPVAKLILTPDFRVSDISAKQPEGDQSEVEISAQELPESVPETGEPEVDSGQGNILDAVEELLESELAGTERSEPKVETSSESGDAESINLESTIADLEAAVAAQQGEWEPDGSGFQEDADAEEPMTKPADRPEQDWPEQDCIDGTAQEVGADTTPFTDSADNDAAAPSEDADIFGDETSVIDEEALRDMVSEIVRRELQGALGERITRNVRKLVRREINHTLSARDFE